MNGNRAKLVVRSIELGSAHLNECARGAGWRNWLTIFTKAFDMKLDGLADELSHL